MTDQELSSSDPAEQRRSQLAANPGLSSWRCGRLINQIEHMTQFLWFVSEGHNGTEEFPADEIPWRELQIAAIGCCETPERRAAVSQLIDRATVEWNGLFRQAMERLLEGHYTDLQLCNSDVDSLIQDDVPAPEVRQRLGEYCEQFLEPVTHLNDELRIGLVESISGSHFDLFEIGRRLDRGMHSVPVVRAMTVDTAKREATRTDSNSLRSETAWRMPTLPLNNVPVSAEDQQVIQQTIPRMELPDELRVDLTEILVQLHEQAECQSLIASAILCIEEWLAEVEYLGGETEDWPSADLLFYLDHNVAERMSNHRRSKSVDAFSFEIMRYFAEHSRRLIIWPELSDHWQAFNERADRSPGKDTVQSQLTPVRTAFRAVGKQLVKGKDDHDTLGWTLRDLEA